MKYTVFVRKDGYDVPVLVECCLSNAISAVESLVAALSLFDSGCSVCITASKEDE